MTRIGQRFLATIAGMFAALVFVGCAVSATPSEDDSSAEREPLEVVASFSILADMTRQIGGDDVTVHNIVPVGHDPHEYDPLPQDLIRTADADLFVMSGMNLEGGPTGWISRLQHATGISDKKIVVATEGIEPMYLSGEDGQEHEVNPHPFLDVQNGMTMAENIAQGLQKVDPENAKTYQQNLDAYLEALGKMDQKYRDAIAEIPQEDRVLVTSERAYQYMTARYGLTEGYIWAVDTADIGSPEQIQSTIRFIKRHTPPALFIESNVDPRSMETVSTETDVEIFDTLFSDELAPQGEHGSTYLEFLDHNIDTIHAGLTAGTDQTKEKK